MKYNDGNAAVLDHPSTIVHAFYVDLMIDRTQNALTVLADPSADGPKHSVQLAGTSKLFFVTQLRIRSGQVINEQASSPKRPHPQ